VSQRRAACERSRAAASLDDRKAATSSGHDVCKHCANSSHSLSPMRVM